MRSFFHELSMWRMELRHMSKEGTLNSAQKDLLNLVETLHQNREEIENWMNEVDAVSFNRLMLKWAPKYHLGRAAETVHQAFMLFA